MSSKQEMICLEISGTELTCSVGSMDGNTDHTAQTNLHRLGHMAFFALLTFSGLQT